MDRRVAADVMPPVDGRGAWQWSCLSSTAPAQESGRPTIRISASAFVDVARPFRRR